MHRYRICDIPMDTFNISLTWRDFNRGGCPRGRGVLSGGGCLSHQVRHVWCERHHRNAQVQHLTCKLVTFNLKKTTKKHLTCRCLVVVLLWCENTITPGPRSGPARRAPRARYPVTALRWACLNTDNIIFFSALLCRHALWRRRSHV